MAGAGRKDTAAGKTDGSVGAPEHGELVCDLRALRSAGLTKLRSLELPALSAAAVRLTGSSDPAGIEMVLRQAVERLGGGELGDAASYLFGLYPGFRGRTPTALRQLAAENAFGIKSENFRKTRELMVIEQVAEQILVLCREGELRAAHSSMERRQPAESRLAVEWVKRFEAYYRIWTPVIALAGDLTAYRSTLLEPDRRWDIPDEPGRVSDPMTLEQEPYSQEYQAEGYIRFAIYRYAELLHELKQFQLLHGGFWLLSDTETEQQVADALYRIGWHTPNNERDDSWMRMTFKDASGELHGFQHLMVATTIGPPTHAEWQEWAGRCQCTWDKERTADERGSYFATAKTDDGLDEACSLHQVIAACDEYCTLIDEDWMRIADWYRIDSAARRGVMGEELYGT